MPVIPVLRRWKLEDQRCKVILSYIEVEASLVYGEILISFERPRTRKEEQEEEEELAWENRRTSLQISSPPSRTVAGKCFVGLINLIPDAERGVGEPSLENSGKWSHARRQAAGTPH